MKKLFKILKRMCDDFFTKTGDGYILSLTWAAFTVITYKLMFIDLVGTQVWEVIALFILNIAAGFSAMILFFLALCFLVWVFEQTYEYFKDVIDEEWNND